MVKFLIIRFSSIGDIVLTTPVIRCMKEQIEDVLGTLTPREQRVLQLRFGLEDGRSRTLEEVGALLGVTRERVRQIQLEALRNLRAMMESNGISGDTVLD